VYHDKIVGKGSIFIRKIQKFSLFYLYISLKSPTFARRKMEPVLVGFHVFGLFEMLIFN